jgi:hypothetical protein
MSTGIDADLASLRQQVADLQRALQEARAALETVAQAGLHYGSAIGLRTTSGHLVCAEGGGGGEVNATRTGLAAWETFHLERP